MNGLYNKSLYLTVQDLNNIENMIESITNEIQEKIFNNQSSPLRTIQVGDNLNSKTLYDYFPRNLYESISGSGTNIIVTDEGNSIEYLKIGTSIDIYRVFLHMNNDILLYQLYLMDDGPIVLNNGLERSMDYNMGTVTQINTNNDIYQYIKIYDDENIIPDYVKHVWQENEPLSMQKIHNIERGIKNIGKYFYKPTGWLESRDWIIKNGNSVRIQNISYRDLNRWINNLRLINFDNINELNIWNSDINQLEWNKYYDEEWEEL